MTTKKHNRTLAFRTVITTSFLMFLSLFYLTSMYFEKYNTSDYELKQMVLEDLKKDIALTQVDVFSLQNKNKERSSVIIDFEIFKKEFTAILQDLNNLGLFTSSLDSVEKFHLKGHERQGVKENVLRLKVKVTSNKEYIKNDEVIAQVFLEIFTEVLINQNVYKEFKINKNTVEMIFHKHIKRQGA